MSPGFSPLRPYRDLAGICCSRLYRECRDSASFEIGLGNDAVAKRGLVLFELDCLGTECALSNFVGLALLKSFTVGIKKPIGPWGRDRLGVSHGPLRAAGEP